MTPEMPLPVDAGPKNTVYEMTLGSPEDNRVYKVDPTEKDKTSS
jgi:hypothetical protein